MALKEFADCWRRYHRANAHYTAIAEQWRQLIEEEPYETSLKVDDDGSGRIAIYATYEPLPEIFGLELGEMLYQLRAALDHVIYATAVRETGQDPPPDHDVLEFPITMSPDAFQRAAWKIAPLSEEFRPLIEWVQPYNADKVPEPGNVLNTSLGLLHEWARIDRHRRLHVIGSWAAEAKPKLRLPEGVRVVNMEVGEAGFLNVDRDIATFKLEGWRPGMKVEGNPDVMISIAVNEPPYPDAAAPDLAQRCGPMLSAMESLIRVFEDGLTKRPPKTR